MSERQVVIVDAVRSPVGAATVNSPPDTPSACWVMSRGPSIAPASIRPRSARSLAVVSAAGMQTMNVARNAWLAAGLPLEVPATTVDTQWFVSAGHQSGLLDGEIRVVDAAAACGVELMSRGRWDRPHATRASAARSTSGTGSTTSSPHSSRGRAHRREVDITRDDTDAFGLRSQQLGAKAWAEDAFATQIVPVTVPVLDEEGKETGDTITVTKTGSARHHA